MMAAGTAARSAAAPHAGNIMRTPRISARMPKNRGATVLAMLVESELMLYALSNASLSTASAIIVLVMGTVPLVKKPRISASADMIAAEGMKARSRSDMNMHDSQHIRSLSCPILSVILPPAVSAGIIAGRNKNSIDI